MISSLRRLAGTDSRLAAGIVLLAILVVALAAPYVAPQNPADLAALDLRDSRLPPGAVGATGMRYLLGSDVLGRDVLSAILFGLRTSILVAISSSLFALLVGLTLGLFVAYRGGRIDGWLMRLADLQLSFPAVFIALVLLAVLGRGLDKIILALVLAQWAVFARTARSAAAAEVEQDYIHAARTLRLPQWRILFRHLLPNAVPPVAVVATAQIAHAISLEATLSFLGVGLPVTQPSLGLLIAGGFPFLLSGDYWISVFPGIALVMLVGSINIAGEHLRVLLNPRLSARLGHSGAAESPATPGQAPQPSPRALPAPPVLAGEADVETNRPADVVLSVERLTVEFATAQGTVRAVDDVSFELRRGQILGIVGESGSGKSVTGRSIMGLVAAPGRIVAGRIRLAGEDLLGLGAEGLRHIRGNRIAMIFQDPMTTLNPVLRIGTQMEEAILAHKRMSRSAARERAREGLARMGIAAPEERLRCYPHQMSGGMRQRVAIAIALLNEPDVIIADEPTTALDVTVQSQVLAQIESLARSSGTALIWVTHDLAVVCGLADRIAVMYTGRIVESGPTRAVLSRPAHPYTAGLLASIPARNAKGQPLWQLPGQTPSPFNLPPGCTFRKRCARATDECAQPPPLAGSDREVRCRHPLVGETA